MKALLVSRTLLVFAVMLAVLWWLQSPGAGRLHLRKGPWNWPSRVVIVAVPLLFLVLTRARPSDYGLGIESLPLGLLFGGLMLVAGVGLPLLLEVAFGGLSVKPRLQGRVVESLVFQLIGAGLLEELLFRGFFQGEFDRILGSP